MNGGIIILFIIGVLLLAVVQLVIWKFLLGNSLTNGSSSNKVHDTLVANTEQILAQQRLIMAALNIKGAENKQSNRQELDTSQPVLSDQPPAPSDKSRGPTSSLD